MPAIGSDAARILAALSVSTLLLGLGACAEPFSNEDIVFLKALPSQQGLRLELPGVTTATAAGLGSSGLRAAQAGRGDAAVFYIQARDISRGLNGGMSSVFEVVSNVTRHPPTRREENLRAWGPLSDGEHEYILYVNRVVATATVSMVDAEVITIEQRFEYLMTGRRNGSEEWLQLFGGFFAPIGSDVRGVGGFFVSYESLRALDPNLAERGGFTVGYDTRDDGLRLQFAYDDPRTDYGGVGWDSIYRFGRDARGNIDFVFASIADIDRNPARSAAELLLILARWRGDNRGRADVLVTGGDLGANRVEGAECWDEAFRRVYFETSLPAVFGEPVGAVTDCAPGLETPIEPPGG